jgi:uncharacterized membrane protein (UPF0127 family)
MAHFLEPLLTRPRLPYYLRNERTGLTVATTLEAAFDSTSRRRGLIGRARLEPDVAVILAPCSGIHTWFMRFPIDVMFVRRDGVVARVCRGVKPWRMALAFRAFAAIELAAGGADHSETQSRDQLRLFRRPKVSSSDDDLIRTEQQRIDVEHR